MKNYKIIISGGGTGGHIYPALAIAKGVQKRIPKIKFLFVGAIGKMEMDKVPKEGYSIIGLWISGFNRFNIFKNLLLPIKIFVSIVHSFLILKRFVPDVVIGTGGFASGPLLYTASIIGIPVLIQEQNSYPGITNRFLAKKADTICVAYSGLNLYFPNDKIKLTGNPVRENFFRKVQNISEAKIYFKQNKKLKTLLVIGGSLGAKRINCLVEEKLDFFDKNNIQLIWQCGDLYYDQYKKYESRDNIIIRPYIKRMDFAYEASDFIISRAGAIAISELCVVGKPVIFIPSPNVAEDHQTVNALKISNEGAALIIPEPKLKSDFEYQFSKLLNSEKLQEKLKKNIKKLSRPLATEKIVKEVISLLKT